MWLKNRFKKLKRDDVVDAIYKLEKQEQGYEDGISEKQEEIDFLLKKGKKEKSNDLRLLYAKKINHLKSEIQGNVSKCTYLLYNIKLLNRLKDTIDEKDFFLKTSKVSLASLLQDQKHLAKYLNEALNTKISSEDVLTSADSTFSEIQDAYEPNNEIYGVSKNDDELLSMFETVSDEEIKEPEHQEEKVEEEKEEALLEESEKDKPQADK